MRKRTSKSVNGVGNQTSKWFRGTGRRTSKWCRQANERMTEWPITECVYSIPLCLARLHPSVAFISASAFCNAPPPHRRLAFRASASRAKKAFIRRRGEKRRRINLDASQTRNRFQLSRRRKDAFRIAPKWKEEEEEEEEEEYFRCFEKGRFAKWRSQKKISWLEQNEVRINKIKKSQDRKSRCHFFF